MNFDSDGPVFGVEVIMALSLISSLNVYFPFFGFDVHDVDILVMLNGQGTAILLYL